jgi:hypothetical protein
MKTEISLEKLNQVYSYFAKANKTDEKRTEYKVGLSLPADIDQTTFDKIVDHIFTLGRKAVMYGPEKPDRYDYTANLYNPAMAIKGERTETLPKTVKEALDKAAAQLAVEKATGKFKKLFASKANGRDEITFTADMVKFLTLKALGDAKNPKGELFKDKYLDAMLSKIWDIAESKVEVASLENEDF